MSFRPPEPKQSVKNLVTLLAGNRLEPRPRGREFNRSLRAEIRDPAWMLTRQWQLKEFQAEDRGMPAFAHVRVERAAVHQAQLLGDRSTAPVLAYAQDIPLDALTQAQTPPASALTRVQMGQYWLRLLRSSVLPAATRQAIIDAFVGLPAYQLQAVPEDPGDYDLDFAVAATAPEAQALLALAAGQVPDGYALYQDLHADPSQAAILISVSDPTVAQTVNERARVFVARYQAQFVEPTPTAWSPATLENRFAVAAATATAPVVLQAPQQRGDRVEWYSFEVAGATAGFTNPAAERSDVEQDFLPTAIEFAGSPNARWWAFEDRRVSLDTLQGDPSDFSRMLLQDFVFLYQNDWFSLPVSVRAGSVCTVRELTVTDVFGLQYRIQPAGYSDQQEDGSAVYVDRNWGGWSVFALSEQGNRRTSTPRLLLPPTSIAPLVGPAVERVSFARDEAANLVWGLEQLVPDGMGRGLDGNHAAQQVREYLRMRAGQEGVPTSFSTDEFVLAGTVPENWIPFLTTQNAAGAFMLEQGAMPRQVEGLTLAAADQQVHPRSTLLNIVPATEPHLVHERVIPPTGVRVEGAFRRARWYNGRTAVWFGYQQRPRPVDGSSGLAFDQLLPRTPLEGPLGVTAVSVSAAGALDAVRGYALDAANQPVGPLLELDRDLLVDRLTTGAPVYTLRTAAQGWEVAETVVLRESAAGPVVTIATAPTSTTDSLGELPPIADQPPVQMQAWWRADTGVQANASGYILQWDDQSGHNRHLVADPSVAPPMLTTWRGQPAAYFNGTGALALVDLGLSAPSTYTVVLVLQKYVGGNNTMPAMFGADLEHANDLWALDNGFGLNNFNSNIWGIPNAFGRLNQPLVVTAELHSANVDAFRLWVNGQAQTVSRITGEPVNRPLDAVFRLGGSTFLNYGSYWWNGWIAEALIYDRVLSASEQQQLHRYLLARYAIDAAELFGNASFNNVPTNGPGDWFAQTRWQVNNGTASISGGQGVNGSDYLYQDVALEPGAMYQLTVGVGAYTSGGVYVVTNAGNGDHDFAVMGTGIYQHTFVATGASDRYHFAGNNNAVLTLDFISLRRV